ncbi:MAG TPA: hypothetical protein VF026_16395 [Ktedonobacteraceae bacterium]
MGFFPTPYNLIAHLVGRSDPTGLPGFSEAAVRAHQAPPMETELDGP